ncbi:hypothetical protein [Sebaldella sp. S0638]|uniref:hypothetical protein n=1 Tax=Sebaldella sp. S0638 TaxID=2957809 RepID=UPI00209D27C0|nr:hypothetical protein [Sebaldella sp. S0638]MCP1224402.1 hypothetical protein [Sebaldella sp. S0638]
MDSTDSSIKSMYLTLFILVIIEIVLTLLLGNLVAIAVLIIAFMLRTKLMEAGKPASKGIKLTIIGSGIHAATLILGIFSLFSFIFYIIPFFNLFYSIIALFLNIAVFVILIIACIMIYNEYDAIKEV